MTLNIGTSGWSYDHWENVLYPPGLPSRDRLQHYVARFNTVELNASFYRWPRETAFASWRNRLPGGFAMSVQKRKKYKKEKENKQRKKKKKKKKEK